MSTVWKLELQLTGQVQPFWVRVGAQVLTLRLQDDKPCVWVMLDPDAPLKEIAFQLFGTGHTMREDIDECPYVGTFQLGGFVGHVFKVPAT